MQKKWMIDAIKNSIHQCEKTLEEIEELETMEAGEIIVALDDLKSIIVRKLYGFKDCG
jgi:hypothetical protein